MRGPLQGYSKHRMILILTARVDPREEVGAITGLRLFRTLDEELPRDTAVVIDARTPLLDDQILLSGLEERGSSYLLDAMLALTSSARSSLADGKASCGGLVARKARIARLRCLRYRGLQHLLRLWGIRRERQHVLGHET